MPEERREPGSFFNRRMVVFAIASVAGAAFYLLCYRGWGWWWDGFWLTLVGILVGQLAGLAAGTSLRGPKGSDRPFVLGGVTGVGGMMLLWLCLPEGAVTVLGDIARVVLGASVGPGLALACHEDYCPPHSNGSLA